MCGVRGYNVRTSLWVGRGCQDEHKGLCLRMFSFAWLSATEIDRYEPMNRQNDDEEEDFWRTRPSVILAGKIQGFTSPLTTDISQLLPRRGPTADRHITPLRKFHPAQSKGIRVVECSPVVTNLEKKMMMTTWSLLLGDLFGRQEARRRRWTERIEKENIHQRHRCEWHSHSSHLKERQAPLGTTAPSFRTTGALFLPFMSPSRPEARIPFWIRFQENAVSVALAVRGIPLHTWATRNRRRRP